MKPQEEEELTRHLKNLHEFLKTRSKFEHNTPIVLIRAAVVWARDHGLSDEDTGVLNHDLGVIASNEEVKATLISLLMLMTLKERQAEADQN